MLLLQRLPFFLFQKPFVTALMVVLLGACNSSDTADNHPDLKLREYNLPQTKDLTARIVRDTAQAALYFQRGNALRLLKYDSLAAVDYLHAVRLDSTKGEYYSAVGDMLFESHDITNALDWIQKALQKNPNDPKARLKLAKMYLFTKDYKAAFLEINTVLRADAYEPEAYFLKGMVYKDLKDTNKAVSSFQTALQTQPDYKDAHLQLGLIARDRGDATALQYFRNAYQADTNDLFPMYVRGQFYQDRKEWENAKQEYRFTLLHAPEYADAAFAMGFVYLQQDSVEKALPYFRKAAQMDAQNADAVFNAGICEEYLGRPESAQKEYEAALAINPAHAGAKAALQRIRKS